jgi:Arc/MetJ family transcription regulator
MCRTSNVHLVSRTNIEIDDDLIERVMRAYGFKTMREAVDFALRGLVAADPKKILELQGSGWDGDLDVLRGRSR